MWLIRRYPPEERYTLDDSNHFEKIAPWIGELRPIRASITIITSLFCSLIRFVHELRPIVAARMRNSWKGDERPPALHSLTNNIPEMIASLGKITENFMLLT